MGRTDTPVLLVSGVQEEAMLSASISLQLGLPDAVAVRHSIDAGRQQLTRVVSDVTGILEREELDLAHACVSCAIREDIVPTLVRLASMRRWGGIVGCLPVTAEARQVCRVLDHDRGRTSRVAVAAVVTALDGATVADDLLGQDLLAERGLATTHDDRRGVAEVASAMVEYADVVCVDPAPDAGEQTLLTALARPATPIVTDASLLDPGLLASGVHRHHEVEAWVADVRRDPLPPLAGDGAWRLDLRSDRPFHPLRFLDELAVLGGGPSRSRGCFWLPTRPESVCVWDGAGGQASVGSTERWGRRKRLTRITVTGLDGGGMQVAESFRRSLLTDEELATRGPVWEEGWDGFEPWLGPIEGAA